MKIIIVEDSPYIRNSLRKFIAEIKEAYISGEAEDSETAIDLIKSLNPDLILLDVELKESSGFDVLRYVNSANLPVRPIITMFTNHSSLYKSKALAEKADYFFDKSVELEKLLITIEKSIKLKISV